MGMRKIILAISFLAITCQFSYCQSAYDSNTRFPKQYVALQGGLTLLEAPAVFYPDIGISYSRTFMGKGVHQLSLHPQFHLITLPAIEKKFLLSANAEYKLQTNWCLEANFFVGLNYQLRKLAYDRYEYKQGKLENIGSVIHQFGPTFGSHLGYKILARRTFSLSPYIGISLTKLRNSYTHTFTEGFIPSAFFGLKFNLSK
jgi:hypothetical protein